MRMRLTNLIPRIEFRDGQLPHSVPANLVMLLFRVVITEECFLVTRRVPCDAVLRFATGCITVDAFVLLLIFQQLIHTFSNVTVGGVQIGTT